MIDHLSPKNDPAPSVRDRRVSSWWRALAILLALLLFIGGATGLSLFEQFKTQVRHLQGQLALQPQIRQLAVLLDAKQQPAMLVSVDPVSQLIQMQRLNEVREGQEDGLQLWALNGDQAPLSLGLIARRQQTPQLRLDAAAVAALGSATELAVSVEGKDGVSEGQGPSLPWLFRGPLVDKAL
jgi:anti-sigma-K factor RskA